jgi:hypothetical protein
MSESDPTIDLVPEEASENSSSRELALAVDIGGTKMAAGLVTRKGEMVDRDIIRTDRDKNANDLFDSLAVIVKRQLDRAGERHGGRVVVCGIGSAGPIEPDCASVSPLNIPAWRRFPLREAIAGVVGVPVHGDLDAKAFALAEGWLGAARGHSNYLGMVVSTGVGGGVVVDGRLIGQRRTHRSRHRESRRTSMRMRSPWMSGGRSIRIGDRGDHGSSRHRADVRDDAANRTYGRTRGGLDVQFLRPAAGGGGRIRGARVRPHVLQCGPGSDRRALSTGLLARCTNRSGAAR